MNAPGLSRTLWLGVTLVAGVFSAIQDARASCGAESCALDNFSTIGRARRLSFEVSFQTIDQDRPRIGTRGAQVGELPGHHDEVETRNRQVSLRAQLALSPRWSIGASVPYLDRVHRHIVNEVGAAPELRSWQYRGFGDASLVGNWMALGSGDPTTPVTVVLQGGVKLPTGDRHVEAIGGEEPEPHARLGTGSTDLLVGGHLMHFLGVPTLSGAASSLPLFAGVMYMHSGRGTDRYRVGRMFDATAGSSYPLFDRLRLLSQMNFRWRGRDDAGVPHEGAHHHLLAGTEAAHQVTPEEAHEIFENTGGVSVYASPGLRFEAGPLLALSAYLQTPIYQQVNGIQVVAPYHFWIGATYKLP